MKSKIHRCGYCGTPVTNLGKPLKNEAFKKAVNIIEKYGDYRTHQEHGECCVYNEMAQNQTEIRRVTKEMAQDAGMPEIEGATF